MSDETATPSTTTTTTATPSSATTATTVKPGWKTTEFWLALAAKLLGTLFAAGYLGDGSEVSRIAGLAALILSTLGYTVSRTMIKNAAMLALFVMVAHTQIACTSTSRERQLGYTLTGLIAAQSALDAYEKPHVEQIVKECRPDDKAGCEQKVKTFLDARTKARADLKAALDLVGAGYKLNDDKSLANAEAAAAAVMTLLHNLGVL
jgi:hypothetical protein